MSEQPPTPPKGERRRRREAERKAAQATGEHELNQPLTRRERRALDEALASGALELTPDGRYAPTGELPVTTTGQHVLSGLDGAGSEASDGGAEEPGAGEGPERLSWRDTAQEVNALHPPPTMDKSPDGGASGEPEPSPWSGGSAGSAGSAGSSGSVASAGSAASGGSAGSAGSADESTVTGVGQVSRRSMRPRPVDPSAGGPERPSERTATGRRPVIRPPASAQGTRAIDATGELTSIQRAIRDINTGGDQPESDAAWESVPADEGSPEPADDEVGTTPATSAVTPESVASASAEADPVVSPAVSPSGSAASASSAEEDEDEADDSFDMSPRWPSLAAVAAAEGVTPATGEKRAADEADGETPAEEPTGDDSAGESATGRMSDAAGPAPTAAMTSSATSAEQAGTADDSDADTAEPEEADEDADDERHTPRLLQVLYWLVLVLAGLVLGLLVWRMATGDLFGGDGALALAGTLAPLRQ